MDVGQIGLLLLIILLSACSTTPELPNPQRVTLGDVQFRYVVQGESEPVVVFESGFGAPMGNWHKVFPEVGRYATAFAYNRRGYAKLEGANETNNSVAKDVAYIAGGLVLEAVAPGAGTAVDVLTKVNEAATETKGEATSESVRTAKTIVNDLRALLRGTGMPPPYVLVGHSLGGLYSLYYAKTYPEEVAGVVLVDSSHPEQVERCREKRGAKECEGPWLIRMALKSLPDPVYGEWLGKEAAGREVMEAGPFPPIPLFVLSRGHSESKNASTDDVISGEDWQAMQRELAALSPHSRHIVAENSGHFIQEDEPELVIQAIRSLVEEVQADRFEQDAK